MCCDYCDQNAVKLAIMPEQQREGECVRVWDRQSENFGGRGEEKREEKYER